MCYSTENMIPSASPHVTIFATKIQGNWYHKWTESSEGNVGAYSDLYYIKFSAYIADLQF
jgi:hypothetical protein